MNQRSLRSFGKTVRSYLTWGDQVLIICVLLGIVSVIPFLRGEPNGRWAILRLEGKVIERLELHKDRKLTIQGPLGETVLEVQQGRLRVLRSPGPQQICVRQGWIQKPGEALICLPNRISVEIPGHSGIDGITR